MARVRHTALTQVMAEITAVLVGGLFWNMLRTGKKRSVFFQLRLALNWRGGNKHVLSLDGGLSNYAGFVCYFGINFLRKNATFSIDTQKRTNIEHFKNEDIIYLSIVVRQFIPTPHGQIISSTPMLTRTASPSPLMQKSNFLIVTPIVIKTFSLGRSISPSHKNTRQWLSVPICAINLYRPLSSEVLPHLTSP